MPIKINRFHHAGFLVTDAERSAAFYEAVFGWASLPRPDFGFPGRWYDLGNGHQLHLMQIDKMPGQTDQPKFDRHIALEVPELEEAARVLDSLGIPYARSSGRAGAPQIFIRDPDGNMIELR
jgi:glyoxylase I family protein